MRQRRKGSGLTVIENMPVVHDYGFDGGIIDKLYFAPGLYADIAETERTAAGFFADFFGDFFIQFFMTFRFHPAETYTGSTVFRDAFQ